MKRSFDPRTLLARLGLEPKRTRTRRGVEAGALVGLGAVFGAGLLLAARNERLRRALHLGGPSTSAVEAPVRAAA